MQYNEGENEVYVVRKHWIVFVVQVLVALIGAVLPYAMLSFLPLGVMLASVPSAIVGPTFAFIYITWLLILWIGIFLCWTLYYLNVWIVTNERISMCIKRVCLAVSC